MTNALSNLSDEYMERLYQRLTTLLLGMDISNKELANILNLSEDVIEAWINKKRYPKVQYLGSIAKVFGVSVDYLLCRSDSTKRITAEEIRNRYYGRKLITYKRNNAIDLSEFSKEQADAIIEFCNKLKDGNI